MTYKETFVLIKADYQRYTKCIGGGNVINICMMMRKERGFAFSVWLRLAAVKSYLWPIPRFIHHYLSTKYRITIQPHTKIAGGLYFPNCWNIVINPRCEIGQHVTIHEFVNIGANNGENSQIGDNAVINSRVCIVGAVKIGEGAIVQSGSVVTKNIEPHTIVEGSPAKEISKT